ncbi:MAG: metallophosphoesterase [Thermoplasmata archaeon]|nr:metallophosphoesterase [Thermoplasmata archaeon]MCI4355229.1 metallophosphoesterase [Thermoplasmata archaeon]
MSARLPSPRTGRWPGPKEVLALSAEEVDELLDRLESNVPLRPGLLELNDARLQTGVVFGDTHGDWRATTAPVERFLTARSTDALIGLGDYVDRAPHDCPEGSVANALWLLGLAAEFPERVVLIVGNHEMVRRIPALPHDLPEEVDQLWGPEADRYSRILGLLERGPLAVRTKSGAFLSHAGFPRGAPPDWLNRFAHPDDDTLIDVVWSDCTPSHIDRGIAPPFDEAELDKFLRLADCSIFLRGHDPDVTGQPLFHDHCLTLHTTRHYERFGGVIFAELPLDRPVRSTAEVRILHAPVEGQRYSQPGD